MNFQTTTYGTTLLNANTGPITITSFKLGSGYNYIPAPSDTDIHGIQVFTGTPSIPFAANANLIKYSIYLDASVGPFDFGEIGLYVGSNLFALGTSTSLIHKAQQLGADQGNSLRIDAYISTVGTNYDMWFDLVASDNKFRVASLTTPDVLPQSAQASPNVYIIQGADSNQSSILAYTDRLGLWNFDAYTYATSVQATVIASDSMSVTISLADYNASMVPAYYGQIILEFVTGALYSVCRYVKTVIVSGATATLGFNSQLAVQPVVGDKFQLFAREQTSTMSKVVGLVSPTAIPNNSDLNNYVTAGLFNSAAGLTLTNAPPGNAAATLEVIPFNTNGVGDNIQRWSTSANMWWRKLTGASWSAWIQLSTSAVASTSALGAVQIGTGLSVTTAGVLSFNPKNFALTGIPTAPTATPGTNTTQLATTAFAESAVANITSGQISTALGFPPVNAATVGALNGIATLDSSGKLSFTQVPAVLVGAVVYQGVWNAATNTPTLVSGVGTKGNYYKV